MKPLAFTLVTYEPHYSTVHLPLCTLSPGEIRFYHWKTFVLNDFGENQNDLVVFAPMTPTIQLRIARWESFLLTLFTVKSSRPGSDYRTFQILINCEISLSHIKKDTLYRCFISNLKPAHTTRLHHTPQDIIRIIMPVGAMHHLSCELNSLYKHWHSAVKKQKRVWMRK